MTRREKLLHAIALEAAQAIEQLFAFPRAKRAMRFFALYQRVKRGLEEVSGQSGKREDRLAPGSNERTQWSYL